MNEMYEFLRGPCLWATAFIFITGTLLRLAYLYGLSRERDRVYYNHKDLKWALRSIVQWLLPLGSRSMRSKPAFSIAFYMFHLSLFAVPLFLPPTIRSGENRSGRASGQCRAAWLMH